MKTFWLKWRREIIRGGMLFVLVVALGLWVTNRLRGGRDRMVSEFKDRFGAFSVNFDAPGREHGDLWQWRGAVSSSQTIRIRNANGPIAVERADGNHAEVRAEKSWRRSSPRSVRLVAEPGPTGVTICALWEGQTNCGSHGDYEGFGGHRNDVAVRFTVLVPKGVALDLSTMNGALQITGMTGSLKAATLNGGIRVEAAGGPVAVKTVNGGIDATLSALAPGGAELETVNGAVTVQLPEHVDATLDAESVVGRVQADLPVQVTGTVDPKHIRGTLGRGGPTLHVSTVNGEVRLVGIGGGVATPMQAPRPRHARPALPPQPPR